MVRYRGILLTVACWVWSLPIWCDIGQYNPRGILEQGKGQSVSLEFEYSCDGSSEVKMSPFIQ